MQTTPSKSRWRLGLLALLVMAQLAQSVVGYGPFDSAEPAAAEPACQRIRSKAGTDGMTVVKVICSAPGVNKTPKTSGPSRSTWKGWSYVEVECRTLTSRSFPEGVDVWSWRAHGMPHSGAYGGSYDEWHLEEWNPANPWLFVDATWPESWHFTTWECTHYTPNRRLRQVCRTVPYTWGEWRTRSVYKYGYHTSHSTHNSTSTSGHNGYWYSVTPWGGVKSHYGYHTSHPTHNTVTTTGHKGTYKSGTESYYYSETRYRTECTWEWEYYREKEKDVYHEGWTKKCNVSCKTPNINGDIGDLSRTLADPRLDHSPRDEVYGPGEGVAYASFVNLETKVFAANPRDFIDTIDADGDLNRAEPKWTVIETTMPGPNGSTWKHWVVAHPKNVRVTVSGNGGRAWTRTCPIEQFLDPDLGCGVTIDVASKNTSYGGVPDTYMVDAVVEWWFYCGWENNDVYRRATPKPTMSGACNERAWAGPNPVFDRNARDGTIWSEAWQDPTIASEQNGDTGGGNYRIPLRVNEIQSTNRDN